MTDDDLKREVGRVFEMLHAAEMAAASEGQACMAGAFAAGRHLVTILGSRVFPAPAPPDPPAGEG